MNRILRIIEGRGNTVRVTTSKGVTCSNDVEGKEVVPCAEDSEFFIRIGEKVNIETVQMGLTNPNMLQVKGKPKKKTTNDEPVKRGEDH